ncbi:MAG: hypothetical protein ACTHOB_16355 [Ginsengibacter sp.]
MNLTAVNSFYFKLFSLLLYFLLFFLLFHFQVAAQVKGSVLIMSLHDSFLIKLPRFSKDSLNKNTASHVTKLLQSKINALPVRKPVFNKSQKTDYDTLPPRIIKSLKASSPFIIFKNGVANYNYSYRSNLDTPFIGDNIQQHFANLSANILVAQKFPLRVSVYERRSNSDYFRNYTDVRIDFDESEFHRLQSQKLSRSFDDIINKLREPDLKPKIQIQQLILKELNGYLNQPETIKKYLQSKETIINKKELTGSAQYRDSVIMHDSAFIASFEKQQNDALKAEKSLDSLKNKYEAIGKKIEQLKYLFKRNINSPHGTQAIAESLKENGLNDEHFEKSMRNLYALQKLSIGKTMPDYTNLTVKNIEINGLNIEVNKNNLYTAITTGFINFNARDFVFNNQRPLKQYVTAGRIGWGTKNGNHIIFTGYTGRKQLFSTLSQNNTVSVYGLSVESQFLLSKNIRVVGEIAQSKILQEPYVFRDSSLKKPFFEDNSSKAWSIELHSYFPLTRTRLDGLYEHQGINFQSFNLYKINAQTDTWNLKADQLLFGGALHLTAGVKNNDYANPFVQQNYSSNSVFTTLTATLQKRYWPVISVGYIPSSQYSIINNQIYESRYQAFTVNANHSYKIGLVKGLTTAMYNRFFNSSKDSGFIYYNAKNIYISQNVVFAKFSAIAGISHTQNPQYILDIMQAGLSKSVKRAGIVTAGIKLAHLNNLENEIGYYISAASSIGRWGFNVWGERSYIPGWGNILVKNEFINIGFTRYFN